MMSRRIRFLFSGAFLLPLCALLTCTAGNYAATCENPAPEICGNLIDDDCNGIVDDGCSCIPTTQRICWPDRDGNAGVAPANTTDKSGCKSGMQTCSDDGSWDIRCAGGSAPSDEVCGNDIDEDCDGEIDDADACQCVSGTTRDCWIINTAGTISATPPASHDNAFSRCKKGTQLCVNAAWAGSRCLDAGGVNSVPGPQNESLDCRDNNCDGRIDEGLVTACKNAQGCWGFNACNSVTLFCSVPTGLPETSGLWHDTANTINGTWDWNCNGTIETNYCIPTGCATASTNLFINTADANQACAAALAGTGSCPTGNVAYNPAAPALPACGGAIRMTRCAAGAMSCVATATPSDWKVFCK